MNKNPNLPDLIFDESISFRDRYREVFEYQVLKNPVYRKFAAVFGLNEDSNPDIHNIPLLPVRAFKKAKLFGDGLNPEIVFKSSGTSKMQRSTHYLADAGIYRKAIRKEFYRHFPRDEFSILSYTPGYSDNPDSSLIWMMNDLIANDPSGQSRFLPLNKKVTQKQVNPIVQKGNKILLFGAAFGLLDLADRKSIALPDGSVVVETGGMKTYRREISRQDLRNKLSDRFQVLVDSIYSEYGMCELLSQFYTDGTEWFGSPHWAHVTIRHADNPSLECRPGEEGKIGVIDLANLYSCPFILTDDKGIMDHQGRFKVLGRWNKNDLRGCNFLIDRD
ncbi:MAG: hypothetical protein WD604_14885 [Balneolaceae bacterium]